jgi:hypothetical protein
MTVFTDLQARALTAIRRATPRHEWDRLADVVARDRQKIEAPLRCEPPRENFRHLLDGLRAQSYAAIPFTVPDLK